MPVVLRNFVDVCVIFRVWLFKLSLFNFRNVSDIKNDEITCLYKIKVYMSLCFMLLDSVLINFICNCIYVCMSLLLCMSMYTWAYAFMLLDSVLIIFICNCVLCMHEFVFMYVYVYLSLCFILMSMHACFFALWCHVICACKVILYLYVLFM